MIPETTHPVWAKLIKGEVSHRFSQASAAMLFFNLQREYKTNPSKLLDQIDQAHRFFEKYQAALAEDVSKLFR